MNIKSIKAIVNSDYPDLVKEQMIIATLSSDEKVIPLILEILNQEREVNKELILDTNVELSRALIVLQDKNLKYNKKIIADPQWVVGEIIKHYKKWKDYIGCCFKIKELEDEDNNNLNNTSIV